jgi:hypothetical protein
MEVQGTTRCPSCGHANRPERHFRAKCGARLGEVCAACGSPNEPGEDSCGHCGRALTHAPPSPPATGTRGDDADSQALPAGERRQLTVLFSDLVRALSAELDADEWRSYGRTGRRA